MEVVVTFAEGHESGEDVITRGIAVIEGLVAEPVGEGVDAEGGLLDEEDAEDTGVDEATEEVVPSKTTKEGREDEAHEEDDLQVMPVLPDDNWVLVQITDVCAAGALWVLLHDHPAEVGVEETLTDGVGVFVGAVLCQS